jgi:ferric-dicitrate binding protein FerR (iron transport regulator)
MDIQEFDRLLNRYFRGQLAEGDYQQLASLLQEKTFRDHFEKEKQAWNNHPELDETGRKNWIRLQFRISNTVDPARNGIPIRRLWIKVAAILVLGMLGGGILSYYLAENRKHSEEIVFETPRGEKSLVKLPDGTQVWLNASSRLVYHTFSKKQRDVELTGEAFFRVTKNARAPFFVRIGELEVKVLGTAFNVMAYEDFDRMEITLVSGKIQLTMDDRPVFLEPGQAFDLKDNKFSIREVNSSLAVGWVDNKFIFQNIPFSELIRRLENWYDVDIEIDSRQIENVNFTGTFKNEETIWQVLEAIKVYTPITYDKTDHRRIKINVKNKEHNQV